ncbi:unnamed protein product [Symbiodinium natans]|uniref:DNA alkylation repair enzyme n=1 Tax=Symbiodinium natans TaxID=878477 RepID=A0A812RTU4_9DINO|nr:unnamed protein product [Symbiodinium natans]
MPPQARKRPGAALPVRKPAKGGHIGMVAELVAALQRTFSRHRNSKDAADMTRYVKGKFPYYGLKAPLRRQLAGEVIGSWKHAHGQQEIDKGVARQLLSALYSCEERELHYVGAEVCSGLLRKGLVGRDFLPVVKHGVTTKSWWDTVDIFAASSMSPYLLACGGGSPSPELLQEMDKWAVSSNLWLRRTAILCQLKLKGQTDLRRLESYIVSNASDKDFFVRKAIGWALREYAKHDPKWVRQFLTRHKSQLSALSVREASLHLSK